MNTQQIETAARQGIQQVQQTVQTTTSRLNALQPAEQQDLVMLGAFFVGLFVVCSLISRKRSGGSGSMLDRVVFRWDRANAVTARTLISGGIHVAGGTGSGKTSSFKQIARAILAFRNSSMLVLCPKPGDYLDWIQLAKEAGRSRDVILIDPEHGNYLNFIGHVARQASDAGTVAQEVTGFLMTVREVVLRQSNQTGGESQIWKQQDERAIKSAVTLLELAGEEINANNISRLILSAPQSDAEMKTDFWKNDYCSQCLKKAHAAAKDVTSRHDFEQAGTYMTREWAGLGEKTRASVLMGTMATLSVLNSGLAWKMFGNTSTFSLTGAIEGRKLVIVNAPVDVHGDLGRIANCGIKHLWQKEILRRKVTNKSPMSVIWADESSEVITSFDASYLSRCRSSMGSMIYLTQSLASYRDVLPGDQADASIKALLGNFTTKVFFALGDYDTAEWAADLVGQELRMLAGTSTTEAQSGFLEFFPERPKVTSSLNQSWEHIVRPEEFMSGLRTGSKVHRYQVDAMIIRFGGKFANGLPVIQTTFDQRK